MCLVCQASEEADKSYESADTLKKWYTSATSTYRDNVLFYANFLTAADLVWLPETGTQTYIVESIVKNDFKSEGTPHASLFTAEGGGFREEDVVLTQ